MTSLELVDRERSGGKTEWIVGRGPFFISHHDDGDELWQSNRPFGVNDRVHKFAAGQRPSLEDVDMVLAEAGILSRSWSA